MKVQTLIDKVTGETSDTSSSIGIALGGGGARGFAHLGVLEALKERNIIPDVLAGTSAGSIVGAFVASGMEPSTVLNLLKKKDLLAYSKIRWPKEGLLSFDGFRETLASEIAVDRIEDLPTKLIITVCNLNKGRVEYLTSGNLIDAVMASSSIPFIFEPVEINGDKYADGGIIDNLPLKPLIDHCEKTIAVSISPVEETEDLDNILKIATRTFQLSVNAQDKGEQQACDLLIEPQGIRKFQLFDVSKADDLFELGYEAAAEINPEDLSIR